MFPCPGGAASHDTPAARKPSMQLCAHQVVKDQPDQIGSFRSTRSTPAHRAGPSPQTPQVFAWLAIAPLVWSNVVASFVPVNPSRDFFSSVPCADLTGPGCGEDGTRTRDLLLAKQALYQLSYFPDLVRQPRVRVPGFEPGTSALSELRSSHLSYTRDTTPSNTRAKPMMVWLPRPRVSSGELPTSRRVNRLVPGNGGRDHPATSRGRLHPGL